MKKILMIEDDLAILKGLEILFDDYKVFTATDGLKGYEAAKEIIPDLLLLDVNLPSMNGFKICSLLKEEGCPFPIFLLTSLTDVASRLEGLSYGADDYITKPFDSAELQLRVKNALCRADKLADTIFDLDHDLNKAQQIQLGSLPKEFPQHEEYDIYGKLIPAKQVSGDYFDFLLLDKKTFALVSADVMGKGMPAALYVQKMQGILHSNKEQIKCADDIINLLQKYLGLQAEWYVAAASAFFDFNEKTVELARAGHPPILIKKGREIEMIKSPGFPIGLGDLRRLGLVDDISETEKYELRGGDNFLFYSDGIIESESPAGEFFGTTRLKNIFLNSPGKSFDVVNNIFDEVKKFSGKEILSDDATLVSVIIN